MKGRVWFGKRVTLNPITEDMIVPFAIFAAGADGKFTVNRTQHYLVEEFDRLYDGRLHSHPAWKQWRDTLDLLDDKVAGAFAGTINLQEYEAPIDSLAVVYEQLRASFEEKPKQAIFASLGAEYVKLDSIGRANIFRRLQDTTEIDRRKLSETDESEVIRQKVSVEEVVR